MIVLIRTLLTDFPMCHICGHRDLPQIPDDNSLIEPESWLEECPCFDAAREYGYLREGVPSTPLYTFSYHSFLLKTYVRSATCLPGIHLLLSV